MKNIFRKIIHAVFSVLPSGAPAFLYTKILKVWPFRHITNFFLHSLIPESVTLPEGKLFLNKKDAVVSGALSLGVYERYETELFRSVLKEGMTVLDIGANIGYYTVIAMNRVGLSGKVFSFEPEPENFAFLQKNIDAQKTKNARAFFFGLADKPSRSNLYLSSDNKGKHSLSQSDEMKESIVVSIETGDRLLQTVGVSNVDIIKMDVEGSEPLALNGLEAILTKSSPCILFCEYHPEALTRSGFSPISFLQNIESKGFSIHEIRDTENKIVPVKDFSEITKRFENGFPTNLYCVKK
jgi:FkbM family methyltransferase